MKKLFTLSLFLISSFILFPQDIKILQPVYEGEGTDYWGNDVVVLDNEPIGGIYGIQRANGTIYAAVNDTLSTANLGIVIRYSTNRGDTWQMYSSGVGLRAQVDNLKMVRSGLDSVYCFFQYQDNVYCWNIEQSVINPVLLGNYRTYDIAASSTGNLYIVLDSLPNNSILRYGSTNGGTTWISRGLIANTAAHPKISMSTSGDTLVLNYITVIADTVTAAIRNVRYRETGPGTMAATGSFTDIVPAGAEKHEFRSAFRNGEIFFAYTMGPIGSRDIYFRKSMDNGVSFSAEAPITNSPTRDEYWFDIKSYMANTGGFDLVYYSDSASAVPTTLTDQLFFSSNPYGTLDMPMPGTQVNQFPLESSVRGYAPVIVELYYSPDDCGVLYVANGTGGKKVFWDYLTNIIPVELTSFTAQTLNGRVVLNWSTATETNNKGFEIERLEGSTWITAGYVTGNGTTTEQVSYSYTDDVTAAGVYSYRLKQIDLNGSYHYSNTVEAELIIPDEFSLFQNYPNPFNPVTRIKFQIPAASASDVTTLKVFDILGNEIAVLVNDIKPAGIYEIDFNASSLSSGMYFYELKAGKFISVKKMTLLK